METQRYIVDCEAVSTVAEFVGAMNAGFISKIGGTWSGNLDALNDYMSWPERPYLVEIRGSERLKLALMKAQGVEGRNGKLWQMLAEIFEENTQFGTVILK